MKSTIMAIGGPVKSNAIRTALIAPCGMNCRLCSAYTRGKKACPGCRGDDGAKPKGCAGCLIKKCDKMANVKAGYCFTCDSYPCDRLKHLDRRYRTKYGMSMIDNLESIRSSGMRAFVRNEKEKWACPVCGALLCVHKPDCLSCGHKWREKSKDV